MNDATTPTGKYVIISPCRDEAQYMRQTLETVTSQTKKPDLWLIVDDGSTDGSSDILKEYEQQYDYIKIVTRDNRGFRSVGPGVIDTFYTGYKTINPAEFEFICKLDLDLNIPPKYFETLIDKMDANPRLGNCSGKPYNNIEGKLYSEKRGDEHSVGMTKFYRMSCFIQIGGFVREVMWDAIDCHKSREMGWMVRSWDEPELRFIHLRMMGSSQDSIYTGKKRYGFGQYFMGTSFIYLFATGLFRLFDKPILFGSLSVINGYLTSWIEKKPKLTDQNLIAFIRKFQWTSLLKGKAYAIDSFEDKYKDRWNINGEPLPMPLD